MRGSRGGRRRRSRSRDCWWGEDGAEIFSKPGGRPKNESKVEGSLDREDAGRNNVQLSLDEGSRSGGRKLVQAAGRCNNRYVEGLKVGVEDSGRIEDLGQKDLVETRA